MYYFYIYFIIESQRANLIDNSWVISVLFTQGTENKQGLRFTNWEKILGMQSFLCILHDSSISINSVQYEKLVYCKIVHMYYMYQY